RDAAALAGGREGDLLRRERRQPDGGSGEGGSGSRDRPAAGPLRAAPAKDAHPPVRRLPRRPALPRQRPPRRRDRRLDPPDPELAESRPMTGAAPELILTVECRSAAVNPLPAASGGR